MGDTDRRDWVRVNGREGWYRVWCDLSSGRVMIEDYLQCAIGPCDVVERVTADERAEGR